MSFVSQMERGGPGGSKGLPNDLLYDDGQVGWMRSSGHIKRERELRAAWDTVEPRARAVLLAHYVFTSPTEHQGKTDNESTFASFPRRVNAIFGDLSGVAIWLADEARWTRSLVSLIEKKRPPEADWLEETARLAVAWAHEHWIAAKRKMNPRLKRLRDKIGVRP